MKIGLIDVDCHAAKKRWGATIYPNLALAKITAWHRSKGDTVEFALPFTHYDIIYKSKIFNFSPEENGCYIADQIIEGGTGYDIKSRLPQEVDDMQPDFSLYPNVPTDTAYGFLTRGCPNRCAWCVVPRKEGQIRPYWDIEQVCQGRKKAILMDNNILAAGDYAHEQFQKIVSLGVKVDFNQALDARLVTDDFARQMAQIQWLEHNRIRFGCDTTAQIAECERAIGLLESYGFKGQFFLYTMIGGKNDIEECYNRIHHWWQRNQEARKNHDRCAVYPYAQPYRDPDNPRHEIPQWQKDMAGWTNKKMVFELCDFTDFKPRKNFKCSSYFNK